MKVKQLEADNQLCSIFISIILELILLMTSKCTCPIVQAKACFKQLCLQRSHMLHIIAPLALSYSRYKKCSCKSKKILQPVFELGIKSLSTIKYMY